MSKLVLLIVAALAFVSCSKTHDQAQSDLSTSAENLIFPKGDKIESEHFIGTAWLQWLAMSDSVNHIAVGSVTFEPGARTNWHFHPEGQIILALSGVGYYQEEGRAKRTLKKGDVVTCPPDVPHWHGASNDQEFIQVAITSRLKGPTEWLHAVSEEEYHAVVE